MTDEQDPTLPRPPRDWHAVLRDYGLLLLSGVLMFLGFAGFGIWPLAFVGMVPFLFVFDGPLPPRRGAFLRRAMFFAFIAWWGGFHWLVDTIERFGEFPYPLALAFGSVFFAYQALQYVLMLWLFRRARDRGFDVTVALVCAFVTAELVYPKLFSNYYGNSFHMLPMLLQVADLGGPLLLSGLAALGNAAVYVLLRAALRRERLPWRVPAVFAATVGVFLAYGAFRTAEVEARMAAAPARTVGVVQANVSIPEGRRHRGLSLRRHIEGTLDLEETVAPDLVVWAEGAAEMIIPEGANVRRWVYRSRDGRVINTPTLFGAASRREVDGDVRVFNTAFLADADGNVLGSYDKTFLLAFGEYIPFGDVFPILYEASPNTGHYSHGTEIAPLPLGEHRLGVLICYEDISPSYVRQVVAESDPHLFINMTNDAWFERSEAPAVHMALAKFRAIEHHRYLVRATNTGISVIVDPLGREVARGPLFEPALLSGEVRMMEGTTLFQVLGPWPGYLALGAVLYMAFVGRRRRREVGEA
ncbi:MAG: apolipoprotein N-acyltransferase [Sandaracinaceae bacterium]